MTDAGRLAALDGAELAQLLADPRKDVLLATLRLDAVAALADRLLAELPAGDALPPPEARRAAWDLLDLLPRPAIQRRLAADDLPGWTSRILALVERSHYTMGPLFRRRAAEYGTRPLFEIPF